MEGPHLGPLPQLGTADLGGDLANVRLLASHELGQPGNRLVLVVGAFGEPRRGQVEVQPARQVLVHQPTDLGLVTEAHEEREERGPGAVRPHGQGGDLEGRAGGARRRRGGVPGQAQRTLLGALVPKGELPQRLANRRDHLVQPLEQPIQQRRRQGRVVDGAVVGGGVEVPYANDRRQLTHGLGGRLPGRRPGGHPVPLQPSQRRRHPVAQRAGDVQLLQPRRDSARQHEPVVEARRVKRRQPQVDPGVRVGLPEVGGDLHQGDGPQHRLGRKQAPREALGDGAVGFQSPAERDGDRIGQLVDQPSAIGLHAHLQPSAIQAAPRSRKGRSRRIERRGCLR